MSASCTLVEFMGKHALGSRDVLLLVALVQQRHSLVVEDWAVGTWWVLIDVDGLILVLTFDDVCCLCHFSLRERDGLNEYRSKARG